MPVDLVTERTIVFADHGRRTTHLFVDFAVSQALALAVWLLIGFVAAMADFSVDRILAHALLLNLATVLVYFVFFESVFGRTPGKFLTGSVVVDSEFERPSLTRILGRTLSRFVPFEGLTFLGRDASGWHDRWSGTRVVLKPSLDRVKAWSADEINSITTAHQTSAIPAQENTKETPQPDFVVLFADGTQSDWIDRNHLLKWQVSGKVNSTTYVFSRELGDWQLLRDVAGVAPDVSSQIDDVFGDRSDESPLPKSIYQTANIRTGAVSHEVEVDDELPRVDLAENAS